MSYTGQICFDTILATSLEIVINSIFPNAIFVHDDAALIKMVNEAMVTFFGDESVCDGHIINPDSRSEKYLVWYVTCPSKKYFKRIKKFVDNVHFLKYVYMHKG